MTDRQNVVIVGGGYVGLPLGVHAARSGHNVTIFDIDQQRVDAINEGQTPITDVRSSSLQAWLLTGRLKATANPAEAYPDADVVLICVPTPLQPAGTPDVSFVVSAIDTLTDYIKPKTLVALESTVYPGFTREVLVAKLEEHGFKVGEDVFVSFSPERVDPANETWGIANTPKVVGGITPQCLAKAEQLYASIVKAVVPVETVEIAEMVKLLENTHRAVNIALVNEIAVICNRLGVDVWQVIDAAATKPFGFTPFYPGPGCGGHCLSGNEWLCLRDASGVRVGTFASLFSTIEPRKTEVLALDRLSGTTVFSLISAKSKREATRPLLRVYTKDHRELTVTRKHPMLVRRGLDVRTVLAEELTAGDQIVVAKSWPTKMVDAWDNSVDVLEYARNGAQRVRVRPKSGKWADYDRYIRPACRPYGVLAKDVYRSNNLPLDIYLDLEKKGNAQFSRSEVLLSTGLGNSQRTFPAIVEMNEDFARLVGYYLAEGCVTQDKKTLRTCFCFGSHELDLIEDCCSVLSALGVRYSIYRSPKWKAVTIKVASRLFGGLLRDVLECGTRSEDVQVPPRLMAAPAEIRFNVLAGMLRGDGGVELQQGTRAAKNSSKRHRHNYCCVTYYTCSPTLCQQALLLLQGFGYMPQMKRSMPGLIRLHGAQIERMVPLFTSEKKRRLLAYADERKKPMPPKAYVDYGASASVAVREIREVSPETVFSLEVERTHTFITSYGIAVHNCLPCDPQYLEWRMRTLKYEARMIHLAAQVNAEMPRHVVERLSSLLNERGLPLKDAGILLVGLAYKPDVNDFRESPAVEILHLLMEHGADVTCVEPYLLDLPSWWPAEAGLFSHLPRHLEVGNIDAAVIATHHSNIDYQRILDNVPLVFDTRNATKGLTPRGDCTLVRL